MHYLLFVTSKIFIGQIYTETIKLHVCPLDILSASSKCMKAFHSNVYITKGYHLEMLCT